jgi:glycosyltransferase involved in cell wall biosynthesis
MRILALCNCPLDESLGSGYVSLRYAEGLRAAGHQVDLLGPSEYEPFHGRLRGRALSYRQAAGMAAAALHRTRGAAYDLVEICGAQGWLAMRLLQRTPRRRFLVVQRSNGLETHCEEALRQAADAGLVPRRRWFHFSQSRWFEAALRRADGLVTVSAWDRDWALARGYGAPDRVLAIENSLPDSYLGQEVDLERPPAIGYCGSWLPVKGIDLLVRALPPVLRDLPAWRLTLVGVGDGFHAADHFPADVLPRIDVVPYAGRSTRLRELYRGFAVSILPSVYESFGLAAAEAMACGSALVAVRVGFAAGLRDREEALLLPERSPQALGAALRELAANEELRRRIAQGGYRRVQELRWDRAVRTLAEAYAVWRERRDG